MKNDEINIPLTDDMRGDISRMVMDLMELQTRGTFKIYGIPANSQPETAIFSIRCAVGNLIDEDDELEEELR